MNKEISDMINLIKENTKKSRCSLCNSEAYGKGCIYSARGIHLHMDDPKRCGWCGSQNIVGKGCIFSPTGFHGVGANLYTSMIAETFITSFFIKKLKTPFIETKAFELGLITQKGELVKKPSSKDEKNAYTFIESFIFKLKRYLGEKIDLINDFMYLEASKSTLNESLSVEEFEKELVLKKKLENVSREFYDIIAEAEKQNISSAVIEKNILESFLNDKY